MQRKPPLERARAKAKEMGKEHLKGFEMTHEDEWNRPSPKVDAPAPDVLLWDRKTGKTFSLLEQIQEKPLLLIIGSWTCPPFRYFAADPIAEIFEEFQDRLDALIVYTKEAHAENEWPMPIRDREVERKLVERQQEGDSKSQPKTMKERRILANEFVGWMEKGVDRPTGYRYPIPVAVDGMENDACSSYAAFPFRIFVLGTDGTLLYESGWGPFDVDLAELEQWLENYLSVVVN